MLKLFWRDEEAKNDEEIEKKEEDTKMDVNVNSNLISDTMKTMANVTDMLNKKPDKTENNTSNNSNATVEVKVGDHEKKPDPVILKEKHETHIHKEFPDNRPLTDKECDISLKKAEMEHELKLKEMEYQHFRDEQERKDIREKEARERADFEKAEKKRKLLNCIGAALSTIGVVIFGCYSFKHHGRKQNQPKIPASTPIETEGKVSD